jgi:hypothetical protein
MIRRAQLCTAVALASLTQTGCGGKVAGYDNVTVGPDGGRVTPVPTCDAICAHIIGSCVPGASTGACVSDCEAGQSRFAMTSCAPLLEAYLRCMGTTRVECNGSDVVVVDCSDERNQLDACHP